jgi:pyruvate/2-oxoglutarate dehydrogenase complex dihydrolipoamide acyltransferase (E2) component
MRSVAVILPKFGMTMTDAYVRSWHRASGDKIEKGEILVEVETDKTTIELEAPATGVLGEILVPAGEETAVGTLLATIEMPD